MRRKITGDPLATGTAVFFQPIVQYVMPGAPNQRKSAARTVGCLPLIVKDVPHVAVFDARAHCDLARPPQCRGGGSRLIRHLEIGMEGGEVQGNTVPEILQDPVAHQLGLLRRVVFPGDHEIGNFEPDIGLVLEPLQGIEDRVEMGEGKLMVEAFGEPFEVHVRRVV